ncbi:MAG: hypothetical protein HZA61_11655 [Candidatus Eisenbacteria bacterium]|uniref:Uncharacterized protein n=1 Tax=Eiseniibacteriota bacterium TaxID=2212470 RepID=A0A933SDI5_UNCEI|nr:hypothetical protein [Candidatus Eisenbacteria bacterium]
MSLDDDEDAAPEVSKPTVGGAAGRVIVGLVVVLVVAAVVQWERSHISSPVAELPVSPAAEAESFELAAAAADSALELSWREDPRAEEYQVELLAPGDSVLAQLAPVRTSHGRLERGALAAMTPGAETWCRVYAVRAGERIAQSAKLAVTLP